MYSKCGMVAEAQRLFHTFSSRIVYIFSKFKDEEVFLKKNSVLQIPIPDDTIGKFFHLENAVEIILQAKEKIFKRGRESSNTLFTDDGLVLGLAFILRVKFHICFFSKEMPKLASCLKNSTDLKKLQ